MDEQDWEPEGISHQCRRRFLRTATSAGIFSLGSVGSVSLGTATTSDAGNLLWEYEVVQGIRSTPTVVDGTAYLTARNTKDHGPDQNVYAIDVTDGTEEWAFETENEVHVGPAVTDDTVYIAEEAENLYALDTETGDERWSRTVVEGAELRTAPMLAFGSVVVGDNTGIVVALDPADGSERWSNDLWSTIEAIFPGENGQLYVWASGDTLHSFDPADGSVDWKQDLDFRISAPPTFSEGTIYAGASGGNLHAIDGSDGSKLWQWEGGVEFETSTPTVADETVFVADREFLYAVDAVDGTERWRYETGFWEIGSPTVAGDAVFVGAQELLSVDAADGTLRWRTDVKSPRSSPIVVDGVVYLGGRIGLRPTHLFAIDAGVQGSSRGSRIALATDGHHGDVHRPGLESDPDDEQLTIENLRLVQTVENTRYVDPDSDRSAHPDRTPVADELVADESHDAVPWTAPEADLVAQRAVAPVFDVTLADPEEQPDLSLTARLVGDDGVVREERATLDAAALRGELSVAHRARLQDQGVVDDEPAPLLESIRDDPDRVQGEYPTLPIASGADVEVELDGPGLERPITETLDVDSDRVRGRRRLSIGFVAFETETWTGTGDYTFDDDALGLVDFATKAATWLNATFPTVGVDIAVVNGRVDAPTANDPRKFRKVVRRAESKFAGSLDDLQTFHVSPDGELSERTVHDVDAAVAVVPRNGFFGGGVAGLGDEDTRGLLPTSALGDDPIANAVIVETGRERTVAHELVHLFAGEIYEGLAAQSVIGNSNHASDAVTSTGFDIQDGAFETVPGARSLMESGTGRWIDEVAYQALIENVDPIPSISPRSVVAWGSEVLDRAVSLHRTFENLPESFLERVPEGDHIRDRLEELEAELAPTIDESDGYWDATADFTEEQRNSIRQATMFTGKIGDVLVGRGANPVGDAPETAEGIGKRVKRETEAIEAAMDRRRDGGVEHVLELDGTLGDGEEIDLEARAVPTVEPVDTVDGRVSIRALDVDGDVLDQTTAATGVELVGRAGTATRADVLLGAVRAPPAAAAVEVSVEPADDDDDDAVRSTTLHPATDPIRTPLETLPDRAFDGNGVRSDALGSLDSVEAHVESRDRASAAEALEQLYEDLHAGFASEFRRQEDDPARSTVLDRIAEQIHRFGGEVPEVGGADDGLPKTWLLGGAGGAAVAAYATKRHLDGPSGGGDE